MRWFTGKFAICLLLGLIIGCVACGGAEETPATATPSTLPVQYIQMGGSAPLTGIGSYMGLSMQKTVDLVIEGFNEAGGVVIDNVRYLIRMTWYDDAYDPLKGRTNVERLINQDKVAYLVGLFGSTFQAAAPFITQQKILVTTTAAGGREVINPDRLYIFKPYQASTERAYASIRWSIEHYGTKKFAILHMDSASSREITEFAVKVCKQLGVETFVEYFSPFAMEYYPMLTRLLANNPDLLFVAGQPLKQARELGYNGIATGILASISVDEIVQAVGVEGAEGYWFSGGLFWGTNSETIEFHDKYVAKYGDYDDQALSWVPLIEVILQGIERAQSVDPTDVMLALDDMTKKGEPIHLPIGDCYWAGVSRYGIARQLVQPIHIMDIHDGEAHLIEILPPPSEEDLVVPP